MFGLTNGISQSSLFKPWWDKLLSSPNWFKEQLGALLGCPMCLGFWIGGAFSVVWMSLSGSIFVDMCVGSATSWALHKICR